MFFVFEIIRNIYESPFLYLSANENFRFLPLTLFIRIAEYSGRVFVRSCERILEYSGARVFVDVNGFRNIPGARVFVHVDGSRNIPVTHEFVHVNGFRNIPGARVFVRVGGSRNIPGALVFVHVDGSWNIPGARVAQVVIDISSWTKYQLSRTAKVFAEKPCFPPDYLSISHPSESLNFIFFLSPPLLSLPSVGPNFRYLAFSFGVNKSSEEDWHYLWSVYQQSPFDTDRKFLMRVITSFNTENIRSR